MSKNMENSFMLKAHEIVSHTNAMLAYWDAGLICRFANEAYFDWFGIKPVELVDKMHISQLLGPLFEKNLAYIKGALQGQLQVFERDIITPTGECRNSMATYSPDIVDGKVLGFYVHVADITPIKRRIEKSKEVTHELLPVHVQCNTYLMNEIEKTLRSFLFLEFPGISFIAKKHHLSESKLKRDFKAVYGTSIFSYYRELQMEVADVYLETRRYSKKQVASMLRFASQANFSSRYQKFMLHKKAKIQMHELEKASDDRYRVFVAQAPFAIAMFNTEFKLMAASAKWLVEYQVEGALAEKSSLEQIFQSNPSLWKERLELALKAETISGEDRNIAMDGNDTWIKWTAQPWFNAQLEVGGVIMFTEDVTAIIEKNRDRDRLLDILLKTSEITRIGAWERDFITGKAVWSKITREILEMGEGEEPAFEKSLQLYKDQDLRDYVRSIVKKALDQGQSFDITVPIQTFKGNEKLVRIIGFADSDDTNASRLYGIFQELSIINKST